MSNCCQQQQNNGCCCGHRVNNNQRIGYRLLYIVPKDSGKANGNGTIAASNLLKSCFCKIPAFVSCECNKKNNNQELKTEKKEIVDTPPPPPTSPARNPCVPCLPCLPGPCPLCTLCPKPCTPCPPCQKLPPSEKPSTPPERCCHSKSSCCDLCCSGVGGSGFCCDECAKLSKEHDKVSRTATPSDENYSKSLHKPRRYTNKSDSEGCCGCFNKRTKSERKNKRK